MTIQMHVVSYISWHNSVFFLQVSRQPITSTVKSWHNNHAACLVAHQQWWVGFTPNVLKCGIAWQDIFWYSIVLRQFCRCQKSIRVRYPALDSPWFNLRATLGSSLWLYLCTAVPWAKCWYHNANIPTMFICLRVNYHVSMFINVVKQRLGECH